MTGGGTLIKAGGSRKFQKLMNEGMMSVRHLRVGNSAFAVILRKFLRAHLKHGDSYCVDIDRYQSVLKHALSKVDFSIATGIYMLPINLNLSMGKSVISNIDIKGH